MKVHIGADHAGYTLKETLKGYLSTWGYEVIDHGAFTLDENDDYPNLVRPVAEAVATDQGESRGIILGGSGQGEDMVADKVSGIRSAEYYGGNLEIVKLAREHNDANILSLGARFLSNDEAKDAVKLFLETPFSSEERHIRRIAKISD